MEQTLRYISISMVISIALFFSLVAIDNIIDFKSNWLFIQHVLSMDTTFRVPSLMERSINNPTIQRTAYYLIITWEFMTALLCWGGAFFLIFNIKKSKPQFNEAKLTAFLGLFAGFSLYMLGFLIIGGEWFSMWQSPTWDAQSHAGLFLTIILFVMLFLKD